MNVAVIDNDTGFVQVLSKRMEGMSWQYRTLAAPVPPDELVAMRINCLVVDLTLLGPNAWDYLERVADRIPGLGLVICTERAMVAQRVRDVRRGADDCVSKPCHPEEVSARVKSGWRRFRGPDARVESDPLRAGELEIR